MNKSFIIRLPEELKERISSVAGSKRTSINKEIISTLEEKYTKEYAIEIVENIKTETEKATAEEEAKKAEYQAERQRYIEKLKAEME